MRIQWDSWKCQVASTKIMNPTNEDQIKTGGMMMEHDFRIKRRDLINWDTFHEEIDEINSFFANEGRRGRLRLINKRKLKTIVKYLDKRKFSSDEVLLLTMSSDAWKKAGIAKSLTTLMEAFRHDFTGWWAKSRKVYWRGTFWLVFGFLARHTDELYEALSSRNLI